MANEINSSSAPTTCPECEAWREAASNFQDAAETWQRTADDYRQAAEKFQDAAETWKQTAESWQETAELWERRATELEQGLFRSPHQVLNVSESASREEITNAFEELSKKYQPDRVATLAPEFRDFAELRLKEINLAYQTLVN